MPIFGNSWIDQVKKILPPSHRSTTIVNYLSSLLDGVQRQDDEMEINEVDLLFLARTNSQTMVLQAYLRQRFSVPGIIVEPDQSLVVGNFVYNESENVVDPIYTYNETEGHEITYIFNDGEIVSTYDFTVKVPISDYTTQLADRIAAVVSRIALSGMTFNVVSY